MAQSAAHAAAAAAPASSPAAAGGSTTAGSVSIDREQSALLLKMHVEFALHFPTARNPFSSVTDSKWYRGDRFFVAPIPSLNAPTGLAALFTTQVRALLLEASRVTKSNPKNYPLHAFASELAAFCLAADTFSLSGDFNGLVGKIDGWINFSNAVLDLVPPSSPIATFSSCVHVAFSALKETAKENRDIICAREALGNLLYQWDNFLRCLIDALAIIMSTKDLVPFLLHHEAATGDAVRPLAGIFEKIVLPLWTAAPGKGAPALLLESADAHGAGGAAPVSAASQALVPTSRQALLQADPRSEPVERPAYYVTVERELRLVQAPAFRWEGFEAESLDLAMQKAHASVVALLGEVPYFCELREALRFWFDVAGEYGDSVVLGSLGSIL